jgi:hypothetical protein
VRARGPTQRALWTVSMTFALVRLLMFNDIAVPFTRADAIFERGTDATSRSVTTVSPSV